MSHGSILWGYILISFVKRKLIELSYCMILVHVYLYCVIVLIINLYIIISHCIFVLMNFQIDIFCFIENVPHLSSDKKNFFYYVCNVF